MRLILIFAFIAFPLIELALLIKLGDALGFWPAFGLVVVTAVVGSSVLRYQGFGVMQRMQDAVADGRPPVEPVVDGVMLLAAGLLLITPGLIADALGLLLLIPPLRHFLARTAFKRWFGPILGPDAEPTRRAPGERPGPTGAGRKGPPPIIEADYERLD
jgi:UPF0716 protein FxsA